MQRSHLTEKRVITRRKMKVKISKYNKKEIQGRRKIEMTDRREKRKGR